MEEIWTEKYRPESIDEIYGHDLVKQKLKAYVRKRSMPHLLFSGPTGSGKTTSAICLAKELHGESWKANMKEMTSSRRGIQVIREDIKDFARSRTLDESGFKIIFMDEADQLTSEAQSAFRRTMEKFSENCRFVLSCNSPSKIIDPIRSRCAEFRFRRLKKNLVKKWIINITDREELDITDDAVEILVRFSDGDLRKCTNILQTAASKSNKITESLIKEVNELTKTGDVREMILDASKGNFMDARDKLDELLIEYGLSGEDVVLLIHDEIYDIPMTNQTRVNLVEKLGDTERNIVESENDRIQLENFLSQLSVRM